MSFDPFVILSLQILGASKANQKENMQGDTMSCQTNLNYSHSGKEYTKSLNAGQPLKLGETPSRPLGSPALQRETSDRTQDVFRTTNYLQLPVRKLSRFEAPQGMVEQTQEEAAMPLASCEK